MSLWASKGNRLGEYLLRNISVVLPTVVLVYINWLWLFPKYFTTKRYWLYSALALVFLYLIFSLGEILIVEWMNFLYPDREQKDLGFDVYALPTSFWRIMNGAAPYTLGLLSSTIFLAIRQKHHDDQEKSALKLENAQTKIKYLQSQISPHFLFNSLNNVHSLILQDKEQASDYVIKLSDLLRFMIYETDKEFITLDQEIDLLRKYVALVGFRIGTSMVNDNLKTSIENKTRKIPPLLIFGILENGIKHSGMGTESVIEFDMTVKENQGSLFVEMNNSISSQKFDNEKKGFGIDSMKKRLDMYYPNAHTFNFERYNNKARTALTINFKV